MIAGDNENTMVAKIGAGVLALTALAGAFYAGRSTASHTVTLEQLRNVKCGPSATKGSVASDIQVPGITVGGIEK